MSKPNPKRRLSVGGIVAPLITLGLLFFFWRAGHKWMTIPVIVFLILYFVALPRLLRSREEKFHRQALRFLSLGQAAEVPRLARRNLLLQLFGRSAPIDAKLGLAYSQVGEYAKAVPCLDNAIPEALPTEKPALQAALAKALLITGDPARAEVESRGVIDGSTQLPEQFVIAARARVGLGKLDDRTASYLSQAERLSPSPDVQLMIDLTRLELALAGGRKVGELPEGADSEQRFLRVWIHLVRGTLRQHRGDRDGALESYARAVKEGKEERCWFANLAYERMERLGKQGGRKQPADDAPRDPAVQRKRKKRR
jgi:tetratricopeptide (TPR) repeat protein